MQIYTLLKGYQQNSGDVSGAATTVLSELKPPWKGYLEGVIIQVTTDVVKGTSTAGTLAAYNGSTELGSLDLDNGQDQTEYFNIPLTTAATAAVSTTDALTVKVKTQPSGGSPAGVIDGFFLLRHDPRETSATNIGRDHGAA